MMKVNEYSFEVIKLLGKGKGGYSYLVKKDNSLFVLKQIHHEPCDYYTFGDKLLSELNDYEKLKKLNLHLPKLIDVDYKNERILKEYIEGDNVFDLVNENKMKDIYYEKIKSISLECKKHNLNIDYYPTNFIVRDDELYYIDYECNEYDIKWDYESWGSKYWSKKNE